MNMKTLNFIIAAFAMLCIAATSRAQTPQGIKYQAIARTGSGEVIANQQVTFRISILLGSAEGNVVYQETQTATTNQFGLANLSIGMGSVVSGIFDSIPWGNGTYFAKIEFDPQGGTNFAVMGTSQLLSVPYSLYSAHAKVADNMPVYPITAGLLSTNWPNPFNNPATGLLVYNTDSAGKTPYNVIPGYYYNAGTPKVPNWVMLSTSNTQNKITDYSNGNGNDYAIDAGPITGASQYNNSGWGYNACNGGSINCSADAAVGYEALYNDASAGSNSALGYEALSSTTQGSNAAIGYQALYSSTGGGNSAIGYQALYGNTGGGNNAIGSGALYDNTGADNQAMGTGALANNGGADNIAIGQVSLGGHNTGSGNIALGVSSLSVNTLGSDNTAVGANTLSANIGGMENCAFGRNGLAHNTSGNYNSATGWSSMQSITSGSYNVANGWSALVNNDVGYDNTVNGGFTLTYNLHGSGNVADGYGALYYNTLSWNTAVGDSAGWNDTYGTYNTYVGYQTYKGGSGNPSNASAIGYTAEVCQSNSMTFGNTNVTTWDFGTCSPYGSSSVMTVNLQGGNFAYMSSAGNWYTTSDRNQKKNFTVINKKEILDKIVALPVTQWNYKWDLASVKHIGPMAQDFYKAFQLSGDSLHITSIDEAGIALAAIQALNEKLETENAALKAQIDQLTQLAGKQDARTTSDEKQIAEIKALINLNQAQASAK